MLVRELADLFSFHTAVRSSPFAATISRPSRLVEGGKTGGRDMRETEVDKALRKLPP